MFPLSGRSSSTAAAYLKTPYSPSSAHKSEERDPGKGKTHAARASSTSSHALERDESLPKPESGILTFFLHAGDGPNTGSWTTGATTGGGGGGGGDRTGAGGGGGDEGVSFRSGVTGRGSAWPRKLSLRTSLGPTGGRERGAEASGLWTRVATTTAAFSGGAWSTEAVETGEVGEEGRGDGEASRAGGGGFSLTLSFDGPWVSLESLAVASVCASLAKRSALPFPQLAPLLLYSSRLTKRLSVLGLLMGTFLCGKRSKLPRSLSGLSLPKLVSASALFLAAPKLIPNAFSPNNPDKLALRGGVGKLPRRSSPIPPPS